MTGKPDGPRENAQENEYPGQAVSDSRNGDIEEIEDLIIRQEMAVEVSGHGEHLPERNRKGPAPGAVLPDYEAMTREEHDAAYQRILELTGLRTQLDLALVLNVRQSSVSDAKRRNRVPYSWLIKLLQLYGANPEWILTGAGGKYMIESNFPRYIKRNDWSTFLQVAPFKNLLEEIARRAGHAHLRVTFTEVGLFNQT